MKWQIDCVWKWANLRTIEHRDFQGEMATTNGSAHLLFDQIIPKVHANEEHWAEGIYVSGGSRIFLSGTPTPKVGVLTYFFGRKLRENKRIWTYLAPPLDPPLYVD